MPFDPRSLARRLVSSVAVLAFTYPLLGANGGGCSAELQPGDGRSATWTGPGDGGDFDGGFVGKVPTPTGPDQPMTCDWYASDNCWKEISAAAVACSPGSEGRFDSERATCTFTGGSKLELAGPISTPSSDGRSIVFVDHRVVDASGSTCFAVKALAPGKGAIATRRGTAVIEWKSLFHYRVVCPDGSSYANDVPGLCGDAAGRWSAKQTPNYTYECDGTRGVCEGVLWGANATGPASVATCR
ncbi:MAG: hypothetical protein JST00_21090 [Deltaproteobacteria bacterium]|nr:hypothetical protein [Deltaproteobacteria bacterium]